MDAQASGQNGAGGGGWCLYFVVMCVLCNGCIVIQNLNLLLLLLNDVFSMENEIY